MTSINRSLTKSSLRVFQEILFSKTYLEKFNLLLCFQEFEVIIQILETSISSSFIKSYFENIFAK